MKPVHLQLIESGEPQGHPTVSAGKIRLRQRLAQKRDDREFIVQGRYPGNHGWEDLTAHDNRLAAIEERKVYDANEPYPHRVITRRLKKVAAKRNPKQGIYPVTTLQMNRMGHVHVWPGKVTPVQTGKYNYTVNGNDSALYFQNDGDLNALRESIGEREWQELSDGWTVHTRHLSDEYFG